MRLATLIVQNGDPSKPVIANGQTYFALQTRQELVDDARFGQLSEDDKRLAIRNEFATHNKHLAAAAKDAGVVTPLDYAIFQDHGYKGLYGGLGAKDIHGRKQLKKSQKILDHMGSTELAANLFRATQAEEKLKRDQVSGKQRANQTHFDSVGRCARRSVNWGHHARAFACTRAEHQADRNGKEEEAGAEEVAMARPSKDKSAAIKAPMSIVSTQSLSAFVKGVCDIMRRSNCASALQYVPELTWILFLRILDAQEQRDRLAAEVQGRDFSPALRAPFRWRDWAAPYDEKSEARTPEGQRVGWKRQELSGRIGGLIAFVNKELLPYLHQLDVLPDGRPNPSASPRQRVIGRIMTAVERVRVDSETNLKDILDRIDAIRIEHIDDQHFFTLSQVYEDLLLKMGEKNSDGGQFFTPREVIRAMVRTIDPRPGETIYDPCCGTGGFLAQSYEWLAQMLGPGVSSTDLEALKHATFYGREKENLVFPIALANLVLHGIDQPNLWHGNTLTNTPTYDALFTEAPAAFDVILTNPPFGGKEGKEAQKNYSFETGSTQVLFLQHIMAELKPSLDGKPGGRCAVVLDEGLLFRTNESAFVETKRKLLDECELWCIVSLPGGVFSTAGAGVKTNLLFFTKGKPTGNIWYYDLSHVKMGKKSPMTLAHFGWGAHGEVLDNASLPLTLVGDWAERHPGEPFPSFARQLAARGTPTAESDFCWTVDFAARRKQAREAMAPHLAEAAAQRAESLRLKEQLSQLRRDKVSDEALAACRELQVRAERAARDAQGKADAIDAACFDLKAVNPSARDNRDTRSPALILNAIEARGRDIALALAGLRESLEASGEQL